MVLSGVTPTCAEAPEMPGEHQGRGSAGHGSGSEGAAQDGEWSEVFTGGAFQASRCPEAAQKWGGRGGDAGDPGPMSGPGVSSGRGRGRV